MTLLRVKGITKWVDLTKYDPFLTVLTGVEPGKVRRNSLFDEMVFTLFDGYIRRHWGKFDMTHAPPPGVEGKETVSLCNIDAIMNLSTDCKYSVYCDHAI